MNRPESDVRTYSFAVGTLDQSQDLSRNCSSLHNQSLTQKVTGGPSRHISRDVRQRVWTAYGGQCADCRAKDYLEFDHIIPVAKGGSNDESNVQLLCRRCNLAKSDKI